MVATINMTMCKCEQVDMNNVSIVAESIAKCVNELSCNEFQFEIYRMFYFRIKVLSVSLDFIHCGLPGSIQNNR